ncbi:cytochrome c peroxidase [Membranihabitans marinus]
MVKLGYIGMLLLLIGQALSCQKEEIEKKTDLTQFPYQPKSFELNISSNYPDMRIPADNPLTVDGIALGRKLFYDPIISRDSTISCASCHNQDLSFKDGKPLAIGIDGQIGRRSSMSLLNIGYNSFPLFWDGRVSTLEEQVDHPINDPLELDHDWGTLKEKLKNHNQYPRLFRAAFGIETVEDIDEDLISKAIAQFERTLISSGQSKYDKVLRGEATFTDDELQGYLMFFDVVPDLPDAECGHCHAEPFFTTFEFKNNGIENVTDLNQFVDKGRFEVTMNELDIGKFKTPSLINAMINPPYMHDGRFQTMEEVLDHYNSGGHRQINTDPLIQPLGLSEKQKFQVIEFIKTLTDSNFLENPSYSAP